MKTTELRKHLDARMTITLRGEENGECKITIDMEAEHPYTFVVENLVGTLRGCAEHIERRIKSEA